VVEVAPFRALEYNPEKVDLARAVSPPFDVISDELLKRLRAASPYNIVHVTLPPAKKGAKGDPFAESDRLLEAWIADGVLRPTKEDLVYAYECHYEHKQAARRMRGVLLRLRLDATYTQVLPHEEIFPKPTEERMKLLKATATDCEPIHLLYSGQTAEQAMWAYVDGKRRPPDLLVPGPDGAVHRYWRITDTAVIATIVDGFKGRRAYIADGHHRYNAAVKYAEERRSREYRPPKNAPWEYKFSLLVNVAEPGLLILPTHRLVKKAKTKGAQKLLEAWSQSFRVHRHPLEAGNPVTQLQEAIERQPGEHVLGAWLGDAKEGFLLEAKDVVVPGAILPGRSHTYRSLDVVYLQRLALEQGMGVPEPKWGDDVAYTRNDDDAWKAVKAKKAIAVLLHRPTRMAQFRAIAEGGEKMPQKSTYFVPKTLSGVALYRIGKPGPVSKPRITS
jgi:uncharacterized protein (DUF1015 family)